MNNNLYSFNTSQVRIWKGKNSLEAFTLEKHHSGFFGGGIVHVDGMTIRYQVITDVCWQVRQVSIRDVDHPALKLELTKTPANLWYRNGLQIYELTGCQEVDISVTPFTNTLALNKLSDDQERLVKAVYIRIPDFCFFPVDQSYQKTGSGRYHYQNLTENFSAELSIDEYGLITEYSGLFKSLPAKAH